MSGIGSEFFSPNTPVPATPATVTAANSGTSLNGTIVTLGQAVGAVGNPGKLLRNTELPFNGFSWLLDQIGQVAGAHLIIKYDPAAAALFEPYIEFQDSTGADTGTLRLDSTGAIYFGVNNGTTATGRQNISIGANAMSRCTTTRDTVAIGAQAGSGAGVAVPSEKNVFIGADNSDIGIGFDTGSDGVFIGANANDNGARNVGNGSVWIGAFINNGAIVLAGDTGANTILIGNSIGTGGNAANTTVIGTAITTSLSNVALVGRFDQNVVIGAALAGEVDDGNKLQVRGNMSVKGIKPAIRTTAVLAETFGANDFTMICDTTAGNMIVDIDPTIHIGSLGNVKKISADVNSVTLTALSGLIFDIGAGTASVSINTQGENLSFQSDGTNIYIL
jgi:hypothetical protein